MQKIKIFFTKNNKTKLSRIPKNSKEYFFKRLKNKDFDLDSGFVEMFFENKINATILSHPGKEIDNDALQELGAKAVRLSQKWKKDENREISLYFDNSRKKSEKFFLEKGVLLGKTSDEILKSDYKKHKTTIKNILHKDLISITKGIDIARYLTSQPSNIINPDSLENYVKKNLENNCDLNIEYFGKKEVEKEKMGLLMAVNQGSKYEPKMIVMEYNPNKSKEKPIVLVGKGLTYDSGGYYAKPYPGMGDMHGDMAGSAVVIAIMASLKKLGIKKRVIGAIGITENMIDANSYKNGDIITARNGKTVYIDHTDAEGRLVMADVLSYTCDKYDPKLVMDFATLTGSSCISVGEMYTAIFSKNKNLINKCIKFGEETNDLVRQLPYDKYTEEAIKGKVSDLNNIGNFGSMLGGSTATAFLGNFVHDKNKRVHFDCAGSALRKKIKREYDLPNALGTGAMVHNVLKFLS